MSSNTSNRLYIINMTEKKVVGFFNNPKGYKNKNFGEHKVSIPDHLSSFSNQQLTDFYNAITGENRPLFHGHFIYVYKEVFNAIKKHCESLEEVLQLDQKAKKVIDQATPSKKGHCFASNSKLVRIARLLSQRDENGEYKVFTLEQLIEYANGSSYCNKNDLTEGEKKGKQSSPNQTRQYISTLKSKTDRFTMNIVKFQTGEYQFQPDGSEKFVLLSNEELKELDEKFPDMSDK